MNFFTASRATKKNRIALDICARLYREGLTPAESEEILLTALDDLRDFYEAKREPMDD